MHTWLPNEQNGLARPPTVKAAGAELGDDAEVLGVEVNGIARAYRLAALRDINRHIINDTVHGVPVSVVYCDISDCARGYTGPANSDPLPIHQAGMKFGDLILKVENVLYKHSTSQRSEVLRPPANLTRAFLPSPMRRLLSHARRGASGSSNTRRPRCTWVVRGKAPRKLLPPVLISIAGSAVRTDAPPIGPHSGRCGRPERKYRSGKQGLSLSHICHCWIPSAIICVICGQNTRGTVSLTMILRDEVSNLARCR